MNIDHLIPLPELPSGLTMICRIGCGGGGEVFMVQDITGKKLALKSIDQRWTEKEFEAVSLLRELPAHPAVSQIFQTGYLPDGKFFYTMELADNVSGRNSYVPDTLAYRIECGTFSAMETLTVIRDIAAGVCHLHEFHVYHGDIKPENIIFVNGQAKLSDFGTLSQNGNAGTPGFIPDNPVSGIDRDCYALSKTLYCTYCRREAADFPSSGEDFDLHELKIISKLYRKGCSIIPAKRFSSATEFVDYITAAVKELEVKPKPSVKFYKIISAAVFLSFIFIALLLFFPDWEKETIPIENKETFHSDEKVMTAGEAPVEVTAAEPEIDRKELFMAKLFFEESFKIDGTCNGLRPDFRQMFEAVYREMPEELDDEFCRDFLQYYQECDKFFQLRRQLSAPDIDDREFLKMYKQNNYHELCSYMYTRSGYMVTEKSNRHIKRVIRLYHEHKLNNRQPDGSRGE